MATGVGTYQTYQAIGNREDLEEAIYNISPTETPFMTAAGRKKATNTKHEWQKDSLRAAAANGVDEMALRGHDALPGLRNSIDHLGQRGR